MSASALAILASTLVIMSLLSSIGPSSSAAATFHAPTGLSEVAPSGGVLTAFANATPSSGPAPLTTLLQGAAHGGTPPYSWTWQFNVTPVYTQNTTFTFTSPGNYLVVLTVVDAMGTWANASALVTVTSGALSLQAWASPAAGQPPLAVNFQASPNGGSPPYVAWTWNFGDGSAAAGVQNPSHTYTSVGSYNATVTVQDSAGASASTTVRVEVSNVVAHVAASTTFGTAPLPVTFMGSATGGTGPYLFNWSFGDGGVAASGSNTTTHTYLNNGTFLAVLQVIDGHGIYAFANVTITVGAGNGSSGSLSVSASDSPSSGTAPLSVQFYASVTGGTAPYLFSWTFGDGSSSSLIDPTHVYTLGGVYQAVVQVTDPSGNSGSASLWISVNGSSGGSGGGGGLNASIFATPTSGTSPLTVDFTSVVSGGTAPYTYQWLFGDGQGSTAANPAHTYQGSGTFLAQLQVVDSAGHVVDVTIAISISSTGGGVGGGSCGNCSPVPQLSAPSSTQVGQVVTFTATLTGGSGTYRLSWNFGDGTTASFPVDALPGQPTHVQVQHAYQRSGSFKVSCVVNGGAATSPSSAVLTVAVTASSTGGHPSIPWQFWALAVALVGAVALTVLLITGQQKRRGHALYANTGPSTPPTDAVLDPYHSYQVTDLSGPGTQQGSTASVGGSPRPPQGPPVGLL